MAVIKVKRGTRAQIDAAATAGQLVAGEPYLITDDGVFAVGLSAYSYAPCAMGTPIDNTPAEPTTGRVYATYDPAVKPSYLTLSNGNLTLQFGAGVGTGAEGVAVATQYVDAATAALYWEVTVDILQAGAFFEPIGLLKQGTSDYNHNLGSERPSIGWSNDGSFDVVLSGTSTTETTDKPTFATGNTLMACLKDGSLYIGKNGTWVGDPDAGTGAVVTGITGMWAPASSSYDSTTSKCTANFGASAWAYTPPTGCDGLFTEVTTPTLGAHTLLAQTDAAGTDPASTDPITTQASGSILFAWKGGLAYPNAPTDNKGNTYTALGTAGNWNGVWGVNEANQSYVCIGAAGGAGHVLTLDKNDEWATHELSMPLIEVIGATKASIAQSYSSSGATNAAPSITTTGPALLLAIWTGDSGTVGTLMTAAPDSGFEVIESYLDIPVESGCQCAFAVKQVDAAGTYDLTWAVTPSQGADLALIAFEP